MSLLPRNFLDTTPPTSTADIGGHLALQVFWAQGGGSQEINAWEACSTLAVGPRMLSALSIALPFLQLSHGLSLKTQSEFLEPDVGTYASSQLFHWAVPTYVNL